MSRVGYQLPSVLSTPLPSFHSFSFLHDNANIVRIYGAIDGAQYDQSAGGWLIPSSNVSKRPEVKVAVGNKMITIEKEQLGWSELEKGSGMVFGAIQSRGDNPFDIFGDTFLICTYAIFDVGKKRFGVVQRPDPTPAGQ